MILSFWIYDRLWKVSRTITKQKKVLWFASTGEKNSDKEYERIRKVSNKFEIKKMKDYHDFCLKCEVLLSEDVFENL